MSKRPRYARRRSESEWGHDLAHCLAQLGVVDRNTEATSECGTDYHAAHDRDQTGHGHGYPRSEGYAHPSEHRSSQDAGRRRDRRTQTQHPTTHRAGSVKLKPSAHGGIDNDGTSRDRDEAGGEQNHAGSKPGYGL
jgi:hypothetical protein